MQAILDANADSTLLAATPDVSTVHVGVHPVARSDGFSRRRVWTGRVLSGVPVLFLIFDGVAKLMKLVPVVEATVKIGYPESSIVPIGMTLLACTLVYLIPRTAILGAVLLTGYLGGAIATHVRLGDPLFSHVLFPIYVAVLLWGGLYLRDARLSRVLSPRQPNP